MNKVHKGPSARALTQFFISEMQNELGILWAIKCDKVQLSRSNGSRVREGHEKSVFRPSARSRAHFPNVEIFITFAQLRAIKCHKPQVSTSGS